MCVCMTVYVHAYVDVSSCLCVYVCEGVHM